MSTRDIRLKMICKIITQMRVASQEQLLHELQKNGLVVTQATLSRDLKILKVGKIPNTHGTYYYVLSTSKEESIRGCIEDFKRGYLSIAFSGNLGIIKTLSGHADTVAIALDRLEFPEVLGTIAGEDTMLVILKSDADQEKLMTRLTNLINKGIE